MVQGGYATRIKSLSDKEEPHYLKTQARSPILEDFGRSNCAILSFKGSNNFVINLDKMNIDFYDKNDLL